MLHFFHCKKPEHLQVGFIVTCHTESLVATTQVQSWSMAIWVHYSLWCGGFGPGPYPAPDPGSAQQLDLRPIEVYGGTGMPGWSLYSALIGLGLYGGVERGVLW